jgi:PEGA domain
MSQHDVDRKLQAAASANPELASLFAGKHDDPSSRYRRLAFLVGGLALAVVLVLAVTYATRPSRRSHEPAVEIDRSQLLAPIKTEASGSGEETSPFTGFAVSIDTDPPGALVSIGGALRGEAPVLANVTCRGAEKVEVLAQKPGFRPLQRQIACRADTLVKITLRLER